MSLPPAVPEARNISLPAFRGDLSWIHSLEGSGVQVWNRSAYWPGGQSGVTIDPGFDLGHAEWYLFSSCYALLLNSKQMAACNAVKGLTGSRAYAALMANTATGRHLRNIRLSEEEAASIFDDLAAPYWSGITERFPILSHDDTPPEVQAVMLSLAFNRGPRNDDLDILGPDLEDRNWKAVAHHIDDMQEEHPLQGVTNRRDEEADYLLEMVARREYKRRTLAETLRTISGAHMDPADSVPMPVDVDLPGVVKTAPIEHTKTIRKVKRAGIWGAIGAAALTTLQLVDPSTFGFLGTWGVLALTALQSAVAYYTHSDPEDFETE